MADNVTGETDMTKPLTDLEWVNLMQDIEDVTGKQESQLEKMKRKTKENPLIPLGVFATCSCLVFGMRAMLKNDSRKSQLFMRGRVIAQSFTIAVCAAGLFYELTKTAKKEAQSITPK